MKSIIKYMVFTIKSRPFGSLLSCLIQICNLLFAAGLYGTASFIISLAALRPTYDAMMLPVVAVRFFGLGRAALSYAERYYSHDTTFHILKKLRLSLYDRMVPVLPDYRSRKGDNLSKVISDVEILQEGILRFIYPLGSSILLLFLGTIISYWFHPLLAGIFCVLFVIENYLLPVILYYYNRKVRAVVSRDKKELYSDLLEMNEGLSEITADSKEADWVQRVNDKLDRMDGVMDSYHSKAAGSEALVVLLQGTALVTVVSAAGYLVHLGQLSGLSMAAAVLAITTLLGESMLLIQTYAKYSTIEKAADNIFGDPVRNIREQDKNNFPKSKDYAMMRLTEDNTSSGISVTKLEMKEIVFRYPDSRRLFDRFTLCLEKGKPVAVIGRSGCGKSTLINMILGFLHPESGTILAEGINLGQLREEDRMEYFSVVDQKPFFFNQTISDNLKLANSDVTEAEIWEVLKKVGLYDLIRRSPEGLNSMVYEWGANLSGGELQRLAIARALIKKSPFYLFDEPTAGLDTVNEKIIMQLILDLSNEAGVLVITHRAVMLEKYHTIIRLDS